MSIQPSEHAALEDRPRAGAGRGLCLVTGASGFIGGHLARRLVQEGYTVRCLIRASSDSTGLKALGVELVTGDLTDPASLALAVTGCDHVLHCGALVSDWATREEISAVNVRGTANLLRAALGAGVRRFVHLSSTDVYGYPANGTNIDESYRSSRFRNWYAQTKLEAEGEVLRATAGRSLETVILRPATVYGPGSKDVVGEIARAITRGQMVLIDRGRANAGLCFLENLLDAVVIAIEHKSAPGAAFNVTDGRAITWRQFTTDLADGLGCRHVRWSIPYPLATAIGFTLEHGYRLLRRTTGLRLAPLLSRQAVQVLGKDQSFSNDALRRVLGWQPRVDYPGGLALTLEWLSGYLARR